MLVKFKDTFKEEIWSNPVYINSVFLLTGDNADFPPPLPNKSKSLKIKGSSLSVFSLA